MGENLGQETRDQSNLPLTEKLSPPSNHQDTNAFSTTRFQRPGLWIYLLEGDPYISWAIH